ncbi:MAG: hypothetical protein AB7O52_08490 [Planctomycetota bacterium]
MPRALPVGLAASGGALRDNDPVDPFLGLQRVGRVIELEGQAAHADPK